MDKISAVHKLCILHIIYYTAFIYTQCKADISSINFLSLYVEQQVYIILLFTFLIITVDYGYFAQPKHVAAITVTCRLMGCIPFITYSTITMGCHALKHQKKKQFTVRTETLEIYVNFLCSSTWCIMHSRIHLHKGVLPQKSVNLESDSPV